MLLLDLYSFCETGRKFTQRDLLDFVSQSDDLGDLARQSNMSVKNAAVSLTKEFMGRMASLGYLSIDNGVMACYGPHKRPFGFSFDVMDGINSKRFKMIATMHKASDCEFFS